MLSTWDFGFVKIPSETLHHFVFGLNQHHSVCITTQVQRDTTYTVVLLILCGSKIL